MFQTIPKPREQLWAAMLLCMSGGVLWLIYSQAQGLTWQFDDLINLKDLGGASTWGGLVNFIFGGVAGPTGRPISLITFLADYEAWPNDPWALVQHSLVWHLMNTGLVFILFRALLFTMPGWSARRTLLAACIAAAWMLMPIHASGILMPIQRMTLISGFFVLATLAAFAHLRLGFEGRKGWAPILLMAVVCGAGLVLATYAKESGVLLLAFVPLVEWCFFRSLSSPEPKVVWRLGLWLAFLTVPIFMLWHLFGAWQDIQTNYLHYRGYSLGERLATQVVILWEYLRQIALPRAALLGPYHDGHAVYSWGQVFPWLALLAWIAVPVTLWRWGRAGSGFAGIALFAVLFYLTAHLLESTVVPLELYFEHRNYVASLGFAAVFVLGLDALYRNYGKMLIPIALGILLFAQQLLALQQITSLWGNPTLAAELWHRMQPHSTRAVQYLAWLNQLQGDQDASLRVLDAFVERHPGHVDVQIQSMSLACRTETAGEQYVRILRLLEAAPSLQRPAGITVGLAALGKSVREGECAGVTLEQYQQLLLALLDHPAIQHSPKVRHHIHHEMAHLAGILERPDARIESLSAAFRDFPSLSGAQAVALALFQNGQNAEALAWIDEAILQAPNSIVGESWRQTLSSLRTAIENIEAMLEPMEWKEGDEASHQ